VRISRTMAALCSALPLGCDPVPDLYVVDASVDAGSEADAAQDISAEIGPADAQDTGPEACVGLSCPSCPPNPGTCCADGVPCVGNDCAVDCAGACSACTSGEMCCSKQGGQPVCRSLDGGKCPP
jgi:hypothetical protein